MSSGRWRRWRRTSSGRGRGRRRRRRRRRRDTASTTGADLSNGAAATRNAILTSLTTSSPYKVRRRVNLLTMGTG
jgi:hypothetical protein